MQSENNARSLSRELPEEDSLQGGNERPAMIKNSERSDDWRENQTLTDFFT